MVDMSEHGDRSGRSLPGAGLAKGLAVTLKTMTRRSTTQQYPDVAPDLPPRSRGVIALLEENCTVCMLCARECPDWCIYIDSHKEEVAVPGAARPRQRNVLDRFDIDFSLCMYCGICVEVCPFDALHWSPEFEYAEYDIKDLLHDKDHLGEWMATVPPPPAHDRHGEPAKEETAAARKAAAPTAPPARPAAPRGTPPARPAPDRVAPPAGDRGTPAGGRPDEGGTPGAEAPGAEASGPEAPGADGGAAR
ncbi:NuoI/complex I 23 kDa subunit family protein [Micromonospora fluostatini]|uniref:NuoI/complex I 23 kDa subunit family protein n=1 Tax=Micromonospora sp. JCM 30529 TaxID=3421643 RepID=UPI003D17CD34